jgi:hypothetical protein
MTYAISYYDDRLPKKRMAAFVATEESDVRNVELAFAADFRDKCGAEAIAIIALPMQLSEYERIMAH